MICVGGTLLILAVGSFLMHYSFSLNWTITGGIAAILLIVGVLILITESLVGGLQAW